MSSNQTSKKRIKFASISFNRPINGLTKSYGIWLNEINGGNTHAPLCYFKKPKWISQKQYVDIIEKVIKTIDSHV